MSGKPWICMVYYAFDGNNFYFISNPGTRHCRNIKNNRHVACAIADSSQKVTSKKTGVQINGIASQIKSDKEISRVFGLWNKANPGFEKFINIENVKNGKMNDRPYIIKPFQIKFFNERLYGPEGFEIFRM